MPYRVSAGFLNNEGNLKTSNMNRTTAGFNLTPTLLDDRLTINLNGKGVFSHNSFADEGAIGAAVQYNPLQPVNKADGSYFRWESNGAPNTMSTLNPVAMLYEQNKDSYIRRFVGNAQFDYKFKFLDGLRANLNLGLDISTTSGWNVTDKEARFPITTRPKTDLVFGRNTLRCAVTRPWSSIWHTQEN